MYVINGFKDFEKLIRDNNLITPNIWIEEYYLKYIEVFNSMLKFLYHISNDDF